MTRLDVGKMNKDYVDEDQLAKVLNPSRGLQIATKGQLASG